MNSISNLYRSNKINRPPTKQKVRIRNPRQRVRMHFKCLQKDAPKEFLRSGMEALFYGGSNDQMMDFCQQGVLSVGLMQWLWLSLFPYGRWSLATLLILLVPCLSHLQYTIF